MLKKFFLLLKRDIYLNFSNFNNAACSIIFFVITASIFPYSVANEHHILKIIGPGIIICALLFATTLASNQIINDDYNCGILEQILLCGLPVYYVILVKIISNFICVTLPCLLAIYVVGFFYNLTLTNICYLQISILLSSLLLSAINCFGAILTMGYKRSEFVASIITLPLNISTLIFTVITAENFIKHQNFTSALISIKIILALTLILIPVCCLFGCLSIKHQQK
jgi:heme exporter protein B